MMYEYECSECKNSWTEDQSIKDNPIEVCPKCKKKTASRIISGGMGHLFRGTGKYKGQYYGNARNSDGNFS